MGINDIKQINNPLTIVAIFAFLAEINATIAISLIKPELQDIFIWFIIGLPTILILLFFATLNWNTKVIYAPSDFQNDDSFMQNLYGDKLTKKSKVDTISKKDITEFEYRIKEKIESEFAKFKKQNPKVDLSLDEIKTKIKSIYNIELESLVNDKNLVKIKEEFLKFRKYPSNFALLFNILEKSIISKNQLMENDNVNYLLSEGWENALNNLINIGLLKGDENNFEINDDFKDFLIKWSKTNYTNLVKIDTLIKSQISQSPKNKSANLNKLRKISQYITF